MKRFFGIALLGGIVTIAAAAFADPRTPPPGSYLRSCSACAFAPPGSNILACTCKTEKPGVDRRATIDVAVCGATPIANEAGILKCGEHRGT